MEFRKECPMSEKLQSVQPPPARDQIATVQQQALHAFQQDLPRLWAERPGQWVAYQGGRAVGFASEKHELYQRCLQAGLERHEFVVFCVEFQETEMDLGPVILD
jgi:hypothetical protein